MTKQVPLTFPLILTLTLTLNMIPHPYSYPLVDDGQLAQRLAELAKVAGLILSCLDLTYLALPCLLPFAF